MRKYHVLASEIYPLLKNLLIILSVWAIKEAVTRLGFECYCLRKQSDDWWTGKEARKLYSFLFLCVPAAVFWIGGIFLKESTWRCITGWRVQEKFRHPARSCACFFWTLGSTGLAPLTWVFLILLDAGYYECAFTDKPTHCFTNEEKDAELYPRQVMDNHKLRFISQVLAYAFAGFCLLAYSLSMLLCRCCSSMTYYQWRHAHHVQELEEQAFQGAAREYYTEDLKKKWKTMFAVGSESDWDFAAELPPTSPEQRGKKVHYTPLQAWHIVHAPVEVTMKGSKLPHFPNHNINPYSQHAHLHAVDPNMVTITVKTEDAGSSKHAKIDVQKSAQNPKLTSSTPKPKRKHDGWQSRSPSPMRRRLPTVMSSGYNTSTHEEEESAVQPPGHVSSIQNVMSSGYNTSTHEEEESAVQPPGHVSSIQGSLDRYPLVGHDAISLTSSIQANHKTEKKKRRKARKNQVKDLNEHDC